MPAPQTEVDGDVPTAEGLDPLRSRSEAEAHVAAACFRRGPARRLGAELEWVVQHSGDPHRPLRAEHLADALGPHAPRSLAPAGPHLPLPGGSAVTVEPGGQVEVSSPACASLPELVGTVDGDTAALVGLLTAAGLALAPGGADPVRPPRRLLDLPRYAAMEEVLDRTGPLGRVMMCSTAAVQVCVDAGPAEELTARWGLLHEVGPVLVAVFANSPRLAGRTTGWASSRMRAWLGLDPTRTATAWRDPDPLEQYPRWALDAPLLCVRTPVGPWAVPHGVSFADWLAGGLPGRPTRDDLDHHLSTLFPVVRPQGHLEVRCIDAQPAGEWVVPVAVVAALLSDPRVVDAARAAAAPAAGRWVPAARDGLRDPGVAAAATAVMDLACRALPAVGAPAAVRRLVERVTEERVRRGRCPADDASRL